MFSLQKLKIKVSSTYSSIFKVSKSNIFNDEYNFSDLNKKKYYDEKLTIINKNIKNNQIINEENKNINFNLLNLDFFINKKSLNSVELWNKPKYGSYIFYAKFADKEIKYIFKEQLKAVRKSKIFNEDELKILESLWYAELNSYIKLMCHFVISLYEPNKDEVEVISVTSKNKEFLIYNEGKLELKKPIWIMDKTFISSVGYKSPLKSLMNGDVFLNLKKYPKIETYYNLNNEFKRVGIIPLLNRIEKSINIKNYIENHYTIASSILNKASIKYSNNEISLNQLNDLRIKLLNIRTVIDKDYFWKVLVNKFYSE